MRPIALLVLLALAGRGGSSGEPPERAVATAEPSACAAPAVHRTPYPGGDERMSQIPWIRGEPGAVGLVGLLWYWPEEWDGVERAQVFTGGVAPAGYSAKVL